MNHGGAASHIAEILRAGYRNIRERGATVNESVIRSVLIDPVLDGLGYPVSHRIPEHNVRGNRLDYACYIHPVTTNPGPAALIVEAKQLGSSGNSSNAPAGRSLAIIPAPKSAASYKRVGFRVAAL